MSAIDEAAEALGIKLLPWQRDLGQRILNGEQVVMVCGRRAGRATLRRVVAKAQEPGDPSQSGPASQLERGINAPSRDHTNEGER